MIDHWTEDPVDAVSGCSVWSGPFGQCRATHIKPFFETIFFPFADCSVRLMFLFLNQALCVIISGWDVLWKQRVLVIQVPAFAHHVISSSSFFVFSFDSLSVGSHKVN